MDARLDKLRKLILHDGTPTNERGAALRRLEALIAPFEGDARQMRVTRSTRIGRQRRQSLIDECGRLEPYAGGRSYAEVIGEMIGSCRAIGLMPVMVDFGFHEAKEPVVAMGFMHGAVPDPMALQTMARRNWPEARVSIAETQQVDGERTLLIFLGNRTPIT